MALFGSKKNTGKTQNAKRKTQNAVQEKKTASSEVSRSTLHDTRSTSDVLIRPRITEKAANMTAQGIYTFDVRQSATKKDVAAAVKRLYKVTPVKITVVNTPAKRVKMKIRRGFGKTTASRKALVFLKKGEQIQFS